MPSEPHGLPRRLFLQYLAAAGVVSAAAAETFAAALAQNAAITKEAIADAEKLAGLAFSDAQREQMAGELSQHLQAYERLRKAPLDNGVPPALVFEPLPPDVKLSTERKASVYSEVKAPDVPDDLEQLAFLPVLQLAKLIAEGDVTSVDLTQMYLARLKRHGEHLHCVITLMEEQALAQAAQADREIAAGKHRGPLHGIPWGAKDLLATKGVRTTWGAEPYENQVPDLDATVVERLRDAGAVLVAKLSMGALAQGGVWYGGSTRNPWSPEQSSSGSSAGPGSATAAGLVGFSIGTETRGSIISPSSTCGVVGLRPTYGRVSRYGAMALSWTMDKIGPMCRSVEDCALVFNAIYGTDGRDDTVVDAPFEWNPDLPLSKIRVGYLASEFDQIPNAGAGRGGGGGRGGPAVDPAVARRRGEERNKLLKDAVDVMRAQGAKLEPMTLPDFPVNALNCILDAEAAAAFDDLTRSGDANQMTNSSWPNSFRTSRFIPAVEYIRAQRARTLLVRQMDAAMAKFDVFLSPSGGNSLGMTNLTGHPAACLKAGFVDGLPQVLMITGKLYDEATVLRVALAYERATKWHTMNPTLDENLRKMTTQAPVEN